MFKCFQTLHVSGRNWIFDRWHLIHRPQILRILPNHVYIYVKAVLHLKTRKRIGAAEKVQQKWWCPTLTGRHQGCRKNAPWETVTFRGNDAGGSSSSLNLMQFVIPSLTLPAHTHTLAHTQVLCTPYSLFQLPFLTNNPTLISPTCKFISSLFISQK